MDPNKIFIEKVKKHRLLYDPKTKDSKKSSKKIKLWEEIARSMDWTADDCKKRWKGLRDTYKKRRRCEESDILKGVKRYKYFDDLSFLDDIHNDTHELPMDDAYSTSSEKYCDESMSSNDPLVLRSSTIKQKDMKDEMETWITSNHSPKTKRSAKSKNDTDMATTFAGMMKECMSCMQNIAKYQTGSEVNSTSLLFQSLAKKITDVKLKSADIREIEKKVICIVYQELAKRDKS